MSVDYQDVLDRYHEIINDKYLNGRSEFDAYSKSINKLYEWQDVAEERGIIETG